MDFAFGEELEMLRKAARDFLQQECPKSYVRAMEKDETGYSPETWRKMAALGWMGLLFPEKYSGSAGNFLDLTVILEEMGRALLPGPFVSTVACGLAVLEYGTEEQKAAFLPQISSGKLVMTFPLIEKADNAKITASQRKGEYLVSGTALFVPYANSADWLLCAAETAEGLTLFIVDRKKPGISTTLLKTLASDKQYEVILSGVPAKEVLGKPGAGREIMGKLREWGALAECGLISGYVQQVLEMTVAYAKQRVQFGRPIGAFQAIQHQCADMLIDVDGVRLLTYEAACQFNERLPATTEIAMAKAWAGDVSRRVCLLGVKIHGGAGIVVDHDMQLYFRRAKAAEIAFGDADFHREILAEQLGL